MKKLGRIALGIFASAAMAVLMLGGLVAYERHALANDGTGQDFVYHYPPLGTDADQLTQILQDLRLAILIGDYHGFDQLAALPQFPLGANITFFNLKSVGLVEAFSDGGVVTFSGQVPVVVYPDAGYVAPTNPNNFYVNGQMGVDGGLVSLNGSTLAGGATVTSGLTSDTATVSGLLKGSGFPAAVDPQQTAAVIVQAGQAAIGTAAGYTFTTATPAGVAFSATPICVCTDVTGANAIKCVASTTACTPTGTTTDTFNWVAVGLK